MASTSTSIDDSVIIELRDPLSTQPEVTQEQILISTTEVQSWNLPLILSHQIVKVEADRDRLIQESSYFRGLLGGSFRESCLDHISVDWNPETVINVLKFMYGCQLDFTFNNFVRLLEGALFFGVESLLLECKTWFSKTTSTRGLRSLEITLDAILEIWNFGLENAINFIAEICTDSLAKNFMWAMSCSSFSDVPYDLLSSCVEHPQLTVDSEKHLCEALLVWLASNAESCKHPDNTGKDYIDILRKMVSIGPIPTPAKCEICGISCPKATTRGGKNKGREYFNCPMGCPFFMWVEHLRLCECGQGQCKVRTAKTPANKGRYFWVCPKSTGVENNGCGRFNWVDEVQPTSPSKHCALSSDYLETSTPIASSHSVEFLKGYLNGAIESSKDKTRILKEVLDVMEKLDLNKGGD